MASASVYPLVSIPPVRVLLNKSIPAKGLKLEGRVWVRSTGYGPGCEVPYVRITRKMFQK